MIRSVFVLALVSGLCGCTNLSYYYQAVEGQMQIWKRSRPIAQVIEDTHTPPQLSERLSLVLRVRDFASGKLALPDNDSYRKYADLGRPFVVWPHRPARSCCRRMTGQPPMYDISTWSRGAVPAARSSE